MNHIQRIKELRISRKLKQSDICRVLGIRQRTYSDYENGRIKIKVDHMISLAKFYDVSMDYISGVTDVRTKYPEY